MPGLPKLPFLVVGGAAADRRQPARKAKAAAQDEDVEQLPSRAGPGRAPRTILQDELAVDPLELALSPDLVPLVDGPGADLLDRVRALRRKLAIELGVVMPPCAPATTSTCRCRPTRSASTASRSAAARPRPAPCWRIGDGLDGLPGTRRPASRSSAWPASGSAEELRGQAELLGATVVDRSSLIITHLSEIVRRHASRLLGREEVAAATRALKRSHPVVVEDLTPALLTLGEIQRVLHALLDEGVSIRDLVRIFEALSLAAKSSHRPGPAGRGRPRRAGPGDHRRARRPTAGSRCSPSSRGCSRRCSSRSVRSTAAPSW